MKSMMELFFCIFTYPLCNNRPLFIGTDNLVVYIKPRVELLLDTVRLPAYCLPFVHFDRCNCAAQIAMANFDVSNNERQASSQGSSGSGPLDIPHQTSSSPSHSPKNSPRPTIKKETPKSDKSSCREVSPSQLEKPECLVSTNRKSMIGGHRGN